MRRTLKAAGHEIPIVAVCKFRDLAEAEAMIAAGETDLVAMARAHIADPAIVGKSLDGREHEVRTCLACNQGCAQHLERNIAITCVVNPIAGREAIWREPTVSAAAGGAQNVLVVGGGPAGAEAAYVAAAEGHRVTLWERSDRLGGRLAMAPRMERRRDFQRFLDLQARRLDAYGVAVAFGRDATPPEIAALRPDLVVLATGSVPVPFIFPSGARALTLDEAVARPESLGHTVAVYDETGDWPAFSLLEHLALRGHRVVALSPLAGIGWRTTIYSTAATRRRLKNLRVRIVPLRALLDHAGDTLATEDLSTGETDVLTGIDTVIAVFPSRVHNPLEAALAATGTRFVLAGDCLAPRTALEAIYEGHAAGRAAGGQP
jgi:NADPH-dependent 2,4-dienoyl-CoA reductase/sulfur reductase-like enzyme